MPTHKSYHSYLIESLKDPVEAAAYLEAVLEDGEMEYIVLALKNVAEAQQDLVKDQKINELNLENYSRLFEAQEPVGITTIATLLGQLGLKLSVTVKDKQPA
jgi:DNA-binding phage protein